MSPSHPLARLRYHVSGAIERGERSAIIESPAPESCDNLSLDRVAGLAQALGLGIDETRRLLAANQPEDWQA